jgi:hypothetical protein
MERMLEKTDYRIDALKHNEISNPFIRNLLTGDKTGIKDLYLICLLFYLIIALFF